MSGRVLLGGRDTVPLAGAWAVVHHVTRGGGAPTDSVRTDARGRYRFTLTGIDTAAAYVVSAWYDGVAYFSLPVNVRSPRAAQVEDLIAFPATRNGPPVRLARRLLTIARPAADGTREVLEILELENTGLTTRITEDSLVPTWAGALPRGTVQFEAGQGDISGEAIVRRGDSVHVLGPMPPGPGKQLSYGYVIPAGTERFVVPIDQPTNELNLLLQDTTAVVTASAGPLDALGVPDIEGRRFAAYRTGLLAAGTMVTITLPPGALRPQALVPYLVGLLAAAMAGALVWALRKKPALAPRRRSS